MARNYPTHKRTSEGKAQTLARRAVRQTKYLYIPIEERY